MGYCHLTSQIGGKGGGAREYGRGVVGKDEKTVRETVREKREGGKKRVRNRGRPRVRNGPRDYLTGGTGKFFFRILLRPGLAAAGPHRLIQLELLADYLGPRGDRITTFAIGTITKTTAIAKVHQKWK